MTHRNCAKCNVISVVLCSRMVEKVGSSSGPVRRLVAKAIRKMHAAVARSFFASQNRKEATVLRDSGTLRSAKSAGRCGENSICKSKSRKKLRVSRRFLKSRWSKNARRSQNPQKLKVSRRFWMIMTTKSS